MSLIVLISEPAMISEMSRWPLSLRNQKRISGTIAMSRAIVICRSCCEIARLLL